MSIAADRSKLAAQEVPRALRIALITRGAPASTGIGRYAAELETRLRAAGHSVTPVRPDVPLPGALLSGLKRRASLDLRTFLTTYPAWICYPQADVYHFECQTLALLLLFRPPPGRRVVMVHDIIPYLLRNNRELSTYRTAADRLLDRLALVGLRRADVLMVNSEYTRRCLVQHLGLRPDQIQVAYLGVNHENFRPGPVPEAIFPRFGLARDRRYVIYVGSEDPRKDLPNLLRAVAEVRRALPEVELLKVGRAHFEQQRKGLELLATDLGIESAVHFLGNVSEADLAQLYRLADVCVMPSLYEGFGLPAAEAMACGTAVVSTTAGSLPEVVGAAGLLVPPGDVNALTQKLISLLRDDGLRSGLQAQGLVQARQFQWGQMVAATAAVYAGLRAPKPGLAQPRLF